MTPAAESTRDQGGLRQPWSTLPWFTLLLAGAAVLIYLVAGPAPAGLLFDRAALANGEVWRLLTGHLVHSDPAHLAWNLAALVPLGALLELRAGCRGWRYPGLLAIGAFVVDAWLWWLEPDLALYCGLSGLLNSFFAALAISLWRETRHPAFLLALAGGLAKIAVEAANGAALLPTTTWSSVPGAHVAGMAAGLIFVWVVANDISVGRRITRSSNRMGRRVATWWSAQTSAKKMLRSGHSRLRRQMIGNDAVDGARHGIQVPKVVAVSDHKKGEPSDTEVTTFRFGRVGAGVHVKWEKSVKVNRPTEPLPVDYSFQGPRDAATCGNSAN